MYVTRQRPSFRTTIRAHSAVITALVHGTFAGRRGASYQATTADAAIARPALARAAALGVLGVFALSAGVFLSACSSPGDSRLTVFADPGQYDFYSCDQIVGQQKYWQTRELELKQLMDKAEQRAGGAFVNAIAYQAEYVSATDQHPLLPPTPRATHS